MKYANWASLDEVKKNLRKVDLKSKVDKSGIPITSDEDGIYITDDEGHTLVIGATGSGKTQLIALPLINLSMKANESMLINDVKGELYENISNQLLKEGYNVAVIDFDNLNKGDYWNPFELIEKIYPQEKDKAESLIEQMASYLIPVSKPDEFWSNSANNLFVGVTSYLLENEKTLSLREIFDLANSFNDDKASIEFLNNLNKNTSSYCYLTGVLKSPTETRKSIISVLNQTLTSLVSNDLLNKTLSKTSFNIMEFNTKKTALFIIPNRFKKYSMLQTLLINQVYEAISNNKGDKVVNFILDEFDSIDEIKNFSSILEFSRSLRIRFTNFIKSYISLEKTYENQNIDLLKMCFSSIIYLYSNDLYTLEEISKLCGNVKNEKGEIEPLVTKEELRVIKRLNAIVIMNRTMPLKTELVPNWKINWGYEMIKNEIPEK